MLLTYGESLAKEKLKVEFSEVSRMLDDRKRRLQRFESSCNKAEGILRICERLHTEIDTLETREIELYLMIEA